MLKIIKKKNNNNKIHSVLMENSLLFICIKLVTVSKKFRGQYWIIYKDNIYKKKDNILDIRDLILGPKLHSRS